MTVAVPAPMRLVVYGDFSCPFSALASSSAAELERRGVAEVDWRGVEHDTTIAATGEDIDPQRREDFERELAEVRILLTAGELDRLRLPRNRANTRMATETYAAAPPDARPALRERFFSAYWLDGLDLNDSRLVEAIGGDRRDGPTVRRWRDEWSALPQPIVPVMVLPDGYVSRGLGALARLARMTNDPSEIDG